MPNHNDNLGVYAFLGFGVGIYTFFKGFRQFRNYRLVADTPEIPIRSIPMGFIATHGVAKGEQTVQSPVSHTPCLAYKVVIEQWKTDSENHSAGWEHHRTDVDGVSFYLTDAGGSVLVDPRKAELDLPQTVICEAGGGGFSGMRRGANEEELLQYVSRADAQWLGGLVGRGLGAVGALHNPALEQKRQAMLGALQHTPGSPEFMRQMMTMMAPRMKQHFEAMPPQSDPKKEQGRQMMLQAFQHPPGSPEFMQAIERAEEAAGEHGATHRLAAMMQANPQGVAGGFGMFHAAGGRYRLTEYCLVPEGTYTITGTCVENPNARDEYDRNLITQGANEKMFLISCKAERQVEAGLRKSALLKIFGGAALSIICLAVLLAKLGLFH